MPNPTVFSSLRHFLALAKETTQGTAVPPTVTVPVDKFDPEDKVNWLDDRALRGSLTGPYNRVAGVQRSEFAFSGPAFFDTLGFFLNNVFGDLVEQATSTGSGGTTLSSPSVVGATTISTVASIAATTVIQIDTPRNSEVRTVASVTGSGPFTLTLDRPLNVAHLAAATVQPSTNPRIYLFSTLNSGTGQPNSLTLTGWEGPTPTTFGRYYPGACLSDLTLKGNIASSVIELDAKGTAWPSAAAASQPTSAPSAIPPQAAWLTTTGINGTVSGAQIKTITDWEVNIQRQLEVIYTGANTVNPYFIMRGELKCSGKMSFVAADLTPLTYLLTNAQPQLQIIVSNGVSGAGQLTLQIDIKQDAFQTSKPNFSKTAVGYDVTWDAIANTTNAGQSAGFSPISVTLTNAVAAGTY